jgi:RNA polymerase-binding transcription factor DksA
MGVRADVDAEKMLAFRRKALTSAGPTGSDAEHEILEIDAALARIAKGTFGMCEICGGAIGRDRLRALPEARRCLGCTA